MTADDGRRVLRGRVVSGMGGHAHSMTIYAELYEAKTGMRLYPGRKGSQRRVGRTLVRAG